MKDFYHVCFTSHQEAPFRSERDMRILFNCMALAAFSTDTQLIVDATMSTHQHAGIFCENPAPWVRATRCSYTCHFNRKYSRRGPLGDPGFFQLKLEGFRHIEIAFSYILRNALHHGQATTAFGTPHSSVHDIFARDFCRPEPQGLITDRAVIRTFIPRKAEFPDSYVMDASGIFTRASVEQIRQAEAYFVTPRNFLYDMNRLSREEWLRVQDEDKLPTARVDLSAIEPFCGKEEQQRLLANEGGRNAWRGLSDLEVCGIIDGECLRRFRKSSVYQLSEPQKDGIARGLLYDHRIPRRQINRCLYFYDKL